MKNLAYKNKIILFILAVFVLLSPTILRLNNKAVAGIIPYYYLQKFSLNPILFKILPLCFGAGIIFLSYLHLKEIKLKQNYKFIATFLLLLSVPFIYLCTYFTDHSILLFLLLLGFYLFQQKKPVFHILGLVVFLSTIWFELFAIVTPILLLMYSFTLKKKQVYTAICSIVILSYLAYLFLFLGGISSHFLVEQKFFENLILEFGALIGFGITMLILAFFGFLITWKYKFKYIYIYIATAILFILSAKYLFFIIYLNFFIVFFAAFAFQAIIERKWDLKFIGLLAIVALVCSFLFSAVSFADREAEALPTQEMLEALEILAEQPNSVVLTLPEYAFWIEYYTDQKPFSDIFEPRRSAINTIFQSRNLKKTSEFLSANNITYILIDESMKSGTLWSSSDQGLLFLLPSKTHFKNIYNKNHIEIWQFISK